MNSSIFPITEKQISLKERFEFQNTSKVLIRLNDVYKVYQSSAGKFTALNGINLEIESGEFAAIIGKSGSGKTTLINMLTGIDRPTAGEVIVADTSIHNLDENEVAIWRGANMGIVFQFFQLLPTLNVIENIRLPMDFCNLYDSNERTERAMHLLEVVGIGELAHQFPSHLSGGQQQRAAIARALANDPKIVVTDEPTGNLDSFASEQIFSLLTSLVENGKTVIMVTHDEDLARRANRVIYIKDGEINNGITI
jgi:putative ABC transport system ATP-binding protein